MDEMSFLFSGIKKKTIFSVNDFQVVFNTDLKTAHNLEDDGVLREYIRAVFQEKLLLSSGIKSTDEITSIQRLDDLDENKSYIVLDIATSVNLGVEELHCYTTEERICHEEPHLPEDLSSWNPGVPDIPSGPILRWSSEMTNLLIEIRGEMDSDFEKAKYKFRLWEKVASKMNARLSSIQVTAKDCDDKWRNIVATYRKNIDKLKYLGDDSVRWEYFNAMDDVLKGTKNLQNEYCRSDVNSYIQLLGETNNYDEEMKSEPFEIIDVDSFSPLEEVIVDNDELITKMSSGDERIWSTEQCLSLLCWRHQLDNKFIEPIDNQYRCWQELAARLNEKFLVDFSVEEVQFVWNQCNLLYEVNLDVLKSKGVNAVKWKYFAVMDDIRGGTNEISEICIPRPGEYLLTTFRSLRLLDSYCLADDLLCDTNSVSLPSSSSTSVLDNCDSDDNLLSYSSGVFWSNDLIHTLIVTKKSVEEDIVKGKTQRKKLWSSVVRKFRAQRQIRITEEACEEKWRELVKIYQRNLSKAVKSGASTVHWSFFSKMHEVSGSCPIVDVASTAAAEVRRKGKLNGGNASRSEPLKPVSSALPSKFNFSTSNDEENVSGCAGIADSGNLAAAIRELQQNQNKLLREIVDNQQKRIDQLHQEQLSIKSLLLQLLEKLS